MAAAVAAVGTFDPLNIGTPLLRGEIYSHGDPVRGARIMRARTMIPKPFRRFSFATVRTPAGRWTGLLASRSLPARCASTAALTTAAFRRM